MSVLKMRARAGLRCEVVIVGAARTPGGELRRGTGGGERPGARAIAIKGAGAGGGGGGGRGQVTMGAACCRRAWAERAGAAGGDQTGSATRCRAVTVNKVCGSGLRRWCWRRRPSRSAKWRVAAGGMSR